MNGIKTSQQFNLMIISVRSSRRVEKVFIERNYIQMIFGEDLTQEKFHQSKIAHLFIVTLISSRTKQIGKVI